MADPLRVLKKVETTGYGPRKHNPVYECVAPDGKTYRVERHHWCLPTGWGWRATAKGSNEAVAFEDTLDAILMRLEFPDEVVMRYER